MSQHESLPPAASRRFRWQRLVQYRLRTLCLRDILEPRRVESSISAAHGVLSLIYITKKTPIPPPIIRQLAARISDRVQGMGDVAKKFETCAFCIDTQEVLGCVKWGFEIKDKADSKVTPLAGTKNDFALAPSGEFMSAVKQWNAVAAKQKGWHQISKPINAVPNMGGTSALPYRN